MCNSSLALVNGRVEREAVDSREEVALDDDQGKEEGERREERPWTDVSLALQALFRSLGGSCVRPELAAAPSSAPRARSQSVDWSFV